jgi:hypothetical protein
MAIKPGSIVKCVKQSSWNKTFPSLEITIPIVNKTYTVRSVFVSEGYENGLYLEEIKNGPLPLTGIEPSFNESEFIEISEEKNEIKKIANEELILN